MIRWNTTCAPRTLSLGLARHAGGPGGAAVGGTRPWCGGQGRVWAGFGQAGAPQRRPPAWRRCCWCPSAGRPGSCLHTCTPGVQGSAPGSAGCAGGWLVQHALDCLRPAHGKTPPWLQWRLARPHSAGAASRICTGSAAASAHAAARRVGSGEGQWRTLTVDVEHRVTDVVQADLAVAVAVQHGKGLGLPAAVAA